MLSADQISPYCSPETLSSHRRLRTGQTLQPDPPTAHESESCTTAKCFQACKLCQSTAIMKLFRMMHKHVLTCIQLTIEPTKIKTATTVFVVSEFKNNAE